MGKRDFAPARVAVARIAAAAGLVAVAGNAAPAQEHCTPAVQSRLERLGLTRAAPEDLVYGRVYSSGENANLIGYQAWVYPPSCQGQVVFEMSLGCRIHNAFTRRDCKVAGLYHSC